MSAISITSLTAYFSDEPRSIKRGENHYKSQHIESFSFSGGIMRGTVHASMKDKVYKAMVHISGDSIVSTECECPRGSYKCSHSAALFIYAIHNISVTDIECTWKKPKAPTDVKSVKDMYPPVKRNYVPITRETNEDDKLWLISELRKYGQFTGIAWLLSPEPQVSKLPVATIEDIILSEDFISHGLKTEYLLERIKLNANQVNQINDLTVGQRDNPAWHLIRKGRLTASNFGPVLNAKRITPSLLKRVLGEYDLSGVQAIHWGINNEAEALRVFEQTTGLKVTPSGLWLHTSGILGASPDGFVGDDGLLEIKCPFSIRQQSIDTAMCSHKDFYVIKNENNEYELKTNHVYWHQVQGQLHVTGRKMCYFTIWTLVQCLIIQIQRDENWEINIDRLKDFYNNHMLPKIIEG